MNARLLRPAALAVALLASTAAAETLVAETHRATVKRDGKNVHVRWVSVVPVAYQEMRSRLSEGAMTTSLLTSDDATVQVLARQGTAARLRMDRKMPFFLPDVWMEVRALVTTDGDRTRIEWSRLDGSVEKYHRVWTLRPEGEHTHVECVTRLQLPFDIPDVFAQRRMRSQVKEDLAGLANVAGAPPRAP